MKLVKLICIIGIFNRIIIWQWDDYMANKAYVIYHLISWIPLGVLEGKIASVRVSWLIKKWLQINRIPHKEITVSLKSGVEHLHYEMSSW